MITVRIRELPYLPDPIAIPVSVSTILGEIYVSKQSIPSTTATGLINFGLLVIKS